jgi:ribonuclease HI
MSKPNAFELMMKAPQRSEKKTKSGYSIIQGPETTVEEFCHLLQFDGLSEPNPGTSTAGAVIFSPEPRNPIVESGEFMDFATNNKAEYTGLIIGLQAAIAIGVKNILIEGDSQLIIFQTEGKWKVKNADLQVLHKEATALLSEFDFVGIRHIYRDANKYADKITNYVLRSKTSFIKTL